MINKTENGRRNYFRVAEKIDIAVSYKEKNGGGPASIDGRVSNISPAGVSFFTHKPLPPLSQLKIEFKLPESYGNALSRAKVAWRDDHTSHYGAQFVLNEGARLLDLEKFLSELSHNTLSDRRNTQTDDQQIGRRTNEMDKAIEITSEERRRMFRRISDLWGLERGTRHKGQEIRRIKSFQRAKGLGYTYEAVQIQREWLGNHTGTSLRHIGILSQDPSQMQGNIENLIGVAQVPIGVAGPLKINGEHAQGQFFVPMATTEGALVYTYTQGMQLISLAGGANVYVLKDEINISPIFVFENAKASQRFVSWLESNFERIKGEAEKTTRHGKLSRIEPHIFDRSVVVKFCYTTGDAMGLNMINIATEQACKYIVSTVRPEEFYMRSNFSSVKKVSAHNYTVAGFGKMIIADVIVPRKLLKRLFDVSPEAMARYCHLSFVSSAHAGMVGMNGHSANGLTAIFIACGQDVANVVDSQVSVSACETTKSGDLYVSVKIPNLVVATVGGGVDLGTQRECLSILDCYGPGKAKKFAEVVAASVLAGEIAVAAAIVTGTFVDAHKKYGRKPNKMQIGRNA
jgi:hydroxymethylglutaryl-CoA reductase (NADPH)